MKPGFAAAIGTLLLLAVAFVGCSETTAEQFNSTGDSLRNQGLFEEAVVEYSEAIKLAPKLAVAYSGRATAYNALGRDDLAGPGVFVGGSTCCH